MYVILDDKVLELQMLWALNIGINMYYVFMNNTLARLSVVQELENHRLFYAYCGTFPK